MNIHKNARLTPLRREEMARDVVQAGLSRLKYLEPTEPVRRSERERHGEMLHIDIRRLGRVSQVGYRITGDRTGQSLGHGDASGIGPTAA